MCFDEIEIMWLSQLLPEKFKLFCLSIVKERALIWRILPAEFDKMKYLLSWLIVKPQTS